MKALSPEPGTVFVSQFEAVVQLPPAVLIQLMFAMSLSFKSKKCSAAYRFIK
jgi:hypothetical protein